MYERGLDARRVRISPVDWGDSGRSTLEGRGNEVYRVTLRRANALNSKTKTKTKLLPIPETEHFLTI